MESDEKLGGASGFMGLYSEDQDEAKQKKDEKKAENKLDKKDE